MRANMAAPITWAARHIGAPQNDDRLNADPNSP